MARKDKPYLPLYVQDFMTDERLLECSAAATGIYIRIMCYLHKSEIYGKVLLKQKDKQSDNQILNFASKFAKFLPYKIEEIISCLGELINENCLKIEGDLLYQKRMVNDATLSDIRSIIGKKGGNKTKIKTKKFASSFAKAKVKANTDTDNDNVNNIKKEKEIFLWVEEKKLFLNAYEFKEKICKDKNLKMPDVENFQKEFISDQELKENYEPLKELKNHFINWLNLKLKISKNGTHGKINDTGSKPGTSDARVAALKDWSIGGKVHSSD